MPSILITGPTSGIGRAAAVQLAADGWHVVAAGRSRERVAGLVADIHKLGGSAEPLVLDLSSLRSVTSAATTLLESGRRLHALLNNAGVGVARGTTVDGFEIQFGVNHLGHFHLTRCLQPLLDNGVRVVQVASEMHRRAPGIDFDRVTGPTRTTFGVEEYAASKLANILFVGELARRHPRTSTYAVHPGVVKTGIFPWYTQPFLRRAVTPDQGADTVVWCVTDPGLAGRTGRYWAKRREKTPSEKALDEALATELWERSEEWCMPFRPH